MAFDASLALPTVRLNDILRLNKLVRPDAAGSNSEPRRPIQALKAHHRKWMDRVLMGHLSATQYVILSAIVARTFGFGKIIEAIPLSVFSGGMRDPNSPADHHADEDGIPYFRGTGLSLNAIRKALDELAAQRMIERYRMVTRGHDTHAYMPVSLVTFYIAASVDLEREKVPQCFQTGWDRLCPSHAQGLSTFEKQFLRPWEDMLQTAQGEADEVIGQSPVSSSDTDSVIW